MGRPCVGRGVGCRREHATGRARFDDLRDPRSHGLPPRPARTAPRRARPDPLPRITQIRAAADTGRASPRAYCRRNPRQSTRAHRAVSRLQSVGHWPVGAPDLTRVCRLRRVDASYQRRMDSAARAAEAGSVVRGGRPGRRPVLARARGRPPRHRPCCCGSSSTATGLIEVGERVVFQHPLIRSAIYSAATPGERRKVHRGVCRRHRRGSGADRVVWHRAQATSGPDDTVADDLADAAERAKRRGGWVAAAAYLMRAAQLTQDAQQRAVRALAAAQARRLAGAPDAALRLLALAEIRTAGRVGTGGGRSC